SNVSFYGYHDAFTDSAGGRVYYVVVAHPIGNGDFPGLNDFQTLTAVTSHELAESVTNPDGGGWFDDHTSDEIGDLCSGRDDIGYLNGYAVQSEWSVRAGGCVLPAGTTGSGSMPPPNGVPPAA